MGGMLPTSCSWAPVALTCHSPHNRCSQRGQPQGAARPGRWLHRPLHYSMHALSQPHGMLSVPLLTRGLGEPEVQRD